MNGLRCLACRGRHVSQIEKIPGVGYIESAKDDSLVLYGPHLQMLRHKFFDPDRTPPAILLRCLDCRAVWPL